jgi:hypothetical protein
MPETQKQWRDERASASYGEKKPSDADGRAATRIGFKKRLSFFSRSLRREFHSSKRREPETREHRVAVTLQMIK